MVQLTEGWAKAELEARLASLLDSGVIFPPDPEPACGVCEDRGAVREADEANYPAGAPGRWGRCPACQERDDADRLGRLFEGARIPPHFEQSSVHNWPGPWSACAVGCAWLDDLDSAGLLLWGGYGVGKTSLAVALMRSWLDDSRRPALFVTAPDLLDRLRASYQHDAEGSEDDVLRAVREVPFLVLDDLGAERVTDWVRERLFVVINHRHDHQMPTVYTSNLYPDGLADQLGERIVNRLIE